MEKYDAEQKDIEPRIEALTEQIEKQKESKVEPRRFLKLMEKYKFPEELEHDMLWELVDKIIVHQAEGKKPNRTQKIEIFFNFIGAYELTEEDVA